MEKLKAIPKSQLDKIRNSPNYGGLGIKEYGKSDNIKDYSDREITEMYYGIYQSTKSLHVDGDYYLDLTKVSAVKCILSDVAYIKKPNKSDVQTNNYNRLENIRTFYIKDYFLITDEKESGATDHKITRFLYKLGQLKLGRNAFSGLYGIPNDYNSFQDGKNGNYPKDLFHPIKRYINGLFFNDDYRIDNFILESKIKLEKEEE